MNDWSIVKLGDVVKPIRGVTFGSSEASSVAFDGSIACLTTSAVQGKVDWDSKRFIPSSKMPKEERVLHEGDLLVSTANSKALVGKSCIIEEVPLRCTFGAFVTVLRPKETIDSVFLAFWMRTPTTLDFCFEKSSNTTNISNLRVSDLLELEIPLPPLPEQKRIAAILTEKLAAVEKARAATETQLQAAKVLPATYLMSLFESPQAAQWPLRKLSEVVAEQKHAMRRGPFGGAIKKEIFVPSGYKIYEQQNAIRNDFTLGTYYITEEKYRELSGFDVKTDDIIMSCAGTIGKVAIIPQEAPPGIINQALLKITLNKSLMLPQFFKLIFDSNYTRKSLSAISYGSALQNMAAVSTLRELELPVPPIDEQRHIITEAESYETSTTKLMLSIKEQLAEINKLPAALLSQAFSGKL